MAGYDDLFKPATLTQVINNITTQERKVYDLLFKGKERMCDSDILQWDIINAPQRILSNKSVHEPITASDNATRQVKTLTAPRLTDGKTITAAFLQNLRRYGGSPMEREQLKEMIARETLDARNAFDRTLEFWVCKLLETFKIYDADGSTPLYEYDIPTGHDDPAVTENPIADLTNDLCPLIRQNAYANINKFYLLVGKTVYLHLLTNIHVRESLQYQFGKALYNGALPPIGADMVEIIPITSTFQRAGSWVANLTATSAVLVGTTNDWVEVPYAPPVQLEGSGVVGSPTSNAGMFWSQSEFKLNPAAWHIYFESRPLPVLKRPGCVIRLTPTEWNHTS